jgi:hypothetical protein
MSPEPSSRSHARWALRLAAVLIALLIALLLGEVLAVAYYYLRDGRYISPGDRLAAERNAYVEEMRTKDCAYGDSVLVHPFLANVQSNRGPCGANYANSRSFIGKEYPDHAQPRVGYILVTGGSVAAQFTWDNRQQDSVLERILNEQFTGGRYDRFVVLNGGHGAWKQPNQYILFGLYADVLAGVITLDGFNEHYMLGSNQRFEAPSNNFFQIVRRLDARSSLMSEMALRLEVRLYRVAAEHKLFHLSSLAYLIVDMIRGRLRTYAAGAATRTAHRKDDWVNASYEAMFAFTDGMAEAERQRWVLGQYEKYVRLMDAGAKALGIPGLFLLQPTPAFGKLLTEEERPFAEMTNKPAYDAVVRHLTGLREKHGLPVFSLGEVFKDTRERIYKDHIHVNDLGNRLMAERVADLIEQVWGWPRHRAAGARPASRE